MAVLSIVTAAFVIGRSADDPTTVATIGVAFAFHALGSQLPRRRSLAIGLTLAAMLTLFTVTRGSSLRRRAARRPGNEVTSMPFIRLNA